MVMPLIGVTMYGRDNANRFSLPCEYVDALHLAGASVVLLATGASVETLDRLDGVIFAGGGDIDPVSYSAMQHETNYMVDVARDQSEIDLVRRAIERGMPIMAICRGAQIINVALGGTLHAHLPEVYGHNVAHRQALENAPADSHNPTTWILHDVHIDAGTKLSELIDPATCTPASWHHQAIDRLGDGLVVAAKAIDGVIEAVELPGYPCLAAVQWHPEITAADDPVQQQLFNRFVETVRSGSCC